MSNENGETIHFVVVDESNKDETIKELMHGGYSNIPNDHIYRLSSNTSNDSCNSSILVQRTPFYSPKNQQNNQYVFEQTESTNNEKKKKRRRRSTVFTYFLICTCVIVITALVGFFILLLNGNIFGNNGGGAPLGACCLSLVNHDCAETSYKTCQTQNGKFQGDFTKCSSHLMCSIATNIPTPLPTPSNTFEPTPRPPTFSPTPIPNSQTNAPTPKPSTLAPTPKPSPSTQAPTPKPSPSAPTPKPSPSTQAPTPKPSPSTLAPTPKSTTTTIPLTTTTTQKISTTTTTTKPSTTTTTSPSTTTTKPSTTTTKPSTTTTKPSTTTTTIPLTTTTTTILLTTTTTNFPTTTQLNTSTTVTTPVTTSSTTIITTTTPVETTSSTTTEFTSSSQQTTLTTNQITSLSTTQSTFSPSTSSSTTESTSLTTTITNPDITTSTTTLPQSTTTNLDTTSSTITNTDTLSTVTSNPSTFTSNTETNGICGFCPFDAGATELIQDCSASMGFCQTDGHCNFEDNIQSSSCSIFACSSGQIRCQCTCFCLRKSNVGGFIFISFCDPNQPTTTTTELSTTTTELPTTTTELPTTTTELPTTSTPFPTTTTDLSTTSTPLPTTITDLPTTTSTTMIPTTTTMVDPLLGICNCTLYTYTMSLKNIHCAASPSISPLNQVIYDFVINVTYNGSPMDNCKDRSVSVDAVFQNSPTTIFDNGTFSKSSGIIFGNMAIASMYINASTIQKMGKGFSAQISFNVSEEYLNNYSFSSTAVVDRVINSTETFGKNGTCKTTSLSQIGLRDNMNMLISKCTNFVNCNNNLIKLVYDNSSFATKFNQMCMTDEHGNVLSQNDFMLNFTDGRDSGCPIVQLHVLIQNTRNISINNGENSIIFDVQEVDPILSGETIEFDNYNVNITTATLLTNDARKTFGTFRFLTNNTFNQTYNVDSMMFIINSMSTPPPTPVHTTTTTTQALTTTFTTISMTTTTIPLTTTTTALPTTTSTTNTGSTTTHTTIPPTTMTPSPTPPPDPNQLLVVDLPKSIDLFACVPPTTTTTTTITTTMTTLTSTTNTEPSTTIIITTNPSTTSTIVTTAPPMFGACCRNGVSCDDNTDIRNCINGGGFYAGDNTLCSMQGVCSGACCRPNNCENNVDSSTCSNFGDGSRIFQGLGTSCQSTSSMCTVSCCAGSTCIGGGFCEGSGLPVYNYNGNCTDNQCTAISGTCCSIYNGRACIGNIAESTCRSTYEILPTIIYKTGSTCNTATGQCS